MRINWGIGGRMSRELEKLYRNQHLRERFLFACSMTRPKEFGIQSSNTLRLMELKQHTRRDRSGPLS